MAGKDFIESARESLKGLRPTAMGIDPALQRVDVEGGSIDIELFQAEKIERIVLCTIKIHATGIAEKTVMIWPADGYDLPVFWCNLSQMPFMHLNVPILDCIPMLDIVVWPEYAARYLQPLAAVRDKALAALKNFLIDKTFTLPSLVAYALSPFSLLPSIKDEGVDLVPQIVDDYINLYVSFLKDAAPIADAEQSAFCKRKKDATRKLMKGNDPGYPFMLKIFGQETTHKVFDIVF